MEATPSIRQQGMQALQEGNLDKASDLLSRAVMLDDKDNDAKALLGIAYSQKGLHAQAKRALETAVQLEPQNANYRFNLGVVLARAGEMPAAAAAYRDTLLVNPQHAQAKAKLQEFGPQLHQLLAAAPRLNVPAPEGASSSPSAQPPPPAHSAPPGAPMGGAPIGAPPMQQNAHAPPPTAMASSGGDMGSGGPPGTLQCQYCFKHAKVGMVCEFCSQPLPPPPKAVAPPPAMAGGMSGSGVAVPHYQRSFGAPHRGATILTLGILGVLICNICSIAAWIMGNKDLAAMDAGAMDDSGRGLTQTGRIIGMVGVTLNVIGIVIYAAIFIPAILSAARR